MNDLAQIERRLATVERELTEMKNRSVKDRHGNPWEQVRGSLVDEPLFDEWQQAVEEYRLQRDAEESTR